MNCLIDNTITRYSNRANKVDVIRRYIRMKYHINIDPKALKNRLNYLRQNNMEVA